MIRIGQKSVLGLGAAWLATMVVAYQVGDESRGAVSPERDAVRSQETSSSSGDARFALVSEFNETRRLGTENRFVRFAQTLGGDELARILPELTDKMSLSQVQSILKRLFEEVNPGPARRSARFELIGRWAQLDPQAALAHIADLSDPKMRHDLRLKGIEGWASQDPAAALEFALEADDELVEKSKEAVKAGFAETRDLDSAFKFISSLASDRNPDPGWTVAQGVEALYHNDDLAVIVWVERLAPGPVRDQAMIGMVGQWGLHDPESAAEWIEEHADPEIIDRIRGLIKSPSSRFGK
ncbi:MAG: hypothetical protein ACKJSK_21055 [Roseibacillus sp.]